MWKTERVTELMTEPSDPPAHGFSTFTYQAEFATGRCYSQTRRLRSGTIVVVGLPTVRRPLLSVTVIARPITSRSFS